MSQESEPGEEPIEAKYQQIKDLIMQELGFTTEEEWEDLIAHDRESAAEDFTDSDGNPINFEDLPPEDQQEAIYQYMYTFYILSKEGCPDPLHILTDEGDKE